MSKKQNLDLESLNISSEEDKRDATAFAHIMRKNAEVPKRDPNSDEMPSVDEAFEQAYEMLERGEIE